MKYLLIVLLAFSMNSFGESGFKIHALNLGFGEDITATGLSVIYKDFHISHQLLPGKQEVTAISKRHYFDFALFEFGTYTGVTTGDATHLASYKLGTELSFFMQPYWRLNTGVIQPELSLLYNGVQLSFVLSK